MKIGKLTKMDFLCLFLILSYDLNLCSDISQWFLTLESLCKRNDDHRAFTFLIHTGIFSRS